MGGSRLALAAALALVLGVPPAASEDPWPSDPAVCATPAQADCISPYAYEQYLFLEGPGELPPDYAGRDVWKYSSLPSGFPELDQDPRELFGVTGMSVDKAWERSTGRPDVVIAVLDSGIRWQNADLRSKAFLNPGELPFPAGAASHDADFDGVVSVEDYPGADLNGNGERDAGDLVAQYRDGLDGDANGFVDDISGWDFLDDDNDPFDEVDYGHGTGEAQDSAGEAANGGDLPGVCPSCRFLPLRVGQSFVAHDEDYAQAVLYAVDIGAAVVQEALGTVDNVPLARDAHRYAWERGVPIIASAADEAAYHHNFPSGHDYTINVNSIRTGASVRLGPQDVPLQPYPRSFLYLNGCTNFGGNVWVSVSSTSCSSEATGRSAGIAGLLVSHARNLGARGLLADNPNYPAFPSGSPLSAGEVRQLFRLGADDIDLGTKRETVSAVPTLQYASQPGWDQYSGWGRINADKLLALLDQGQLPPEVAFTSPGWWESLDALQHDRLTFTVEVAMRPSSGYELDVEIGCGVQPLLWASIGGASAGGGPPVARRFTETQWVSMPLLTDSLHALGCQRTTAPPAGATDFQVTLRARVTAAEGLVGEDRRTIQLAKDPTLLPGWPRLLEGSGESSADVVDLDGDGKDEIVVPTAAGFVHAFRADGTELPGWPVATAALPLHTLQAAFASGALDPADYHDSLSHGGTALGDADDDSDLEVFASSLNGGLYAWDHLGQPLPGFPVALNPAYSDRSVRDERNTLIPGFQAAPALGDLDLDGDLEVVLAGMDRHVYAWHHTGAAVQGFPVHLADPAKVNVDPATHKVSLKPGVKAYRGAQIVSTTAIGQLDMDPAPEIVVGSNEHYEEPLHVSAASATAGIVGGLGVLDAGNGRLYALNADGSYVAGFPLKVPDLAASVLPYVGEGIPGSPALADLDGDGKDEIVVFATAGPAMVYRGNGQGFYGNGPDGKPLPLPMEAGGPLSGALDLPFIPALGSAAVGRLFPGQPAVVAPAAGLGRALDVALPGEQLVSQDYVMAWDARTSLPLPAWPRPIEDFQFITTPAILNVDLDPLPEVVEGSGGYLLHAWDATGAPSPGFPKATNHWLIGTPAAGDLDGDGKRELVETSREGWLWVWRTEAPDDRARDEWWSDHHDEANTGRWVPLGTLGVLGEESRLAPAEAMLGVLALLGAGVAWRRAGRA